jgi:hypothetical protein
MRLSVASAIAIFLGVFGVTLAHLGRENPPSSPKLNSTPALQDASGKGADRHFDRLAGKWSSGECQFSGDWVLGHQFFRMIFEEGATQWMIMARRDPAEGFAGGGFIVYFDAQGLEFTGKYRSFSGRDGFRMIPDSPEKHPSFSIEFSKVGSFKIELPEGKLLDFSQKK